MDHSHNYALQMHTTNLCTACPFKKMARNLSSSRLVPLKLKSIELSNESLKLRIQQKNKLQQVHLHVRILVHYR